MNPARTVFTYIEVAAIGVALFFCIRWILNPQGPFEPFVAFCTLVLSTIDLWRKHRSDAPSAPETIGEPIVPKISTPKNDPDTLVHFPFASGCAFFAHRFARAFPGVRESTWFLGKDAVERLAILLEEPLRFSLPNRGEIGPVWWFRFGNNAIDHFRVLEPTSVLLDHKELPINRICASYSQSYKHLFVYVEAHPSPPTGLYPRSPEEFKAALNEFGYVWEEYGLFKNTHFVTRAEYDDNTAVILGKVVPLEDECQLRTRYLSPYNFVICGSDSPINNLKFDVTLQIYMNRLLAGEDCLTEFADLVACLPSRTYG
jgi:hypothetical protein